MFELLNSPPQAEEDAREEPKKKERTGVSRPWVMVRVFILALLAGAVVGRLLYLYPWNLLAVTLAAVCTLMFAYLLIRIVVHASHGNSAYRMTYADEGLRHLLESAGPAVFALDLQGDVVYSNPAAERLLGYTASELEQLWGQGELLASEECDRLIERR